MASAPSNFDFLAHYDAALVQIARRAERNFREDDFITTLMVTRQFAEYLAQQIAANLRVYVSYQESQLDLLKRLDRDNYVPAEILRLFHEIRKTGNVASHTVEGDHYQAFRLLRFAFKLAVWFQQTFADPNFKPAKFLDPTTLGASVDALRAHAEHLEQQLTQTQSSLLVQDDLRTQLDTQREQIAELERRNAEIQGERDVYHELAHEHEALVIDLKQRLEARQAQAQTEPDQLDVIQQRSNSAAAKLHHDLNEADTRYLIDQQLRDAGWTVDSQTLTYAAGTRPAKGQNLAIAEWPTKSGPSDYVLFVGLTPIAAIEAKRDAIDVPGVLTQTKRYSRDIHIESDVNPAGGPWGDYRIPFLFATNGRSYLRQLERKSGIWFVDVRRPTNISRALQGWYTPQGLQAMLQADTDTAFDDLKTEPTDYLGLRDYQLAAIRSAEQAIQDGRRAVLLAMATGTGKTRTSLGLLYRLLKAKLFRRILFLVDRTALGEQAANAFKHERLENMKAFTDIYEVKELGDITPDGDTRLHFATIQAMLKRLFYSSDEQPLPVDRYDCIVVDECHRGYNLDREMGDAELTFRNEHDYISKYRRVLDHFDAVKIALTATPALHTTEIFGEPAFTYGYRQAVIDGYLVDHEPPIRIVTDLAEDGMGWKVGEEMATYSTRTGAIATHTVRDEVNIEIEHFNRMVLTENFNRAVCGELARQIDPSLPGKSLVFCVNDSHADVVVDLLKQAFANQYGEVEDDAVVKITGSVDRHNDLFRHYKNERLPSVAVTVDLLTTGIDVPEIVNLVFIRRTKSRILYEQMLGRATRLCPSIGKERFRIFDAVDLYAAIEPYNTMRPVVTNPKITFAQLTQEIATITDSNARQEFLSQFVAKLHSKKRHLSDDARDQFTTLIGLSLDGFLHKLRHDSPEDLAMLFRDRQELGAFLDARAARETKQIISYHDDQVRRVERGYGNATKPEDFLEGFHRFIGDNLNQIPALLIVTQRPRELTRAQLKELSLLLDTNGYSETALRTAWQETTNQDIAASIIGFIRQTALGDPLVPYGERVDRATKAILASRAWTAPQRKWLDRIAKQMKEETIVDQAALDRGSFKTQGGGFARLNKVFDGQLAAVLSQIHDEIWGP